MTTGGRRTRRDILGEQLDLAQHKAAYLLLDNELRAKSDPEYMTQEQIADEVGVNRATLYRWRRQNQACIEFRKEVAKDYLGDAVNVVVDSLIKSMRGTNGAPSMKALDLYAKHIGFINPDNQVDVNIGGGRSDEDLEIELDKLSEQLAEIDGEDDK